jgi:hypothetical protein
MAKYGKTSSKNSEDNNIKPTSDDANWMNSGIEGA